MMKHGEGSPRGPPGPSHITQDTWGHPYGLPRATNRPEPAGELPERSELFFYDQVNYRDIQDELCEPDHVRLVRGALALVVARVQ